MKTIYSIAILGVIFTTGCKEHKPELKNNSLLKAIEIVHKTNGFLVTKEMLNNPHLFKKYYDASEVLNNLVKKDSLISNQEKFNKYREALLKFRSEFHNEELKAVTHYKKVDELLEVCEKQIDSLTKADYVGLLMLCNSIALQDLSKSNIMNSLTVDSLSFSNSYLRDSVFFQPTIHSKYYDYSILTDTDTIQVRPDKIAISFAEFNRSKNIQVRIKFDHYRFKYFKIK